VAAGWGSFSRTPPNMLPATINVHGCCVDHHRSSVIDLNLLVALDAPISEVHVGRVADERRRRNLIQKASFE
jgi:hypothetical protein